MNLDQVVALVTAHDWLGLVVVAVAILTLAVRKLASKDSRFPVTLSPNVLPLVTAGGACVVSLIAAVKAGATWQGVLFSAGELAALGAFVDGLLHTVFADPSKAPTWGKWLLAIVEVSGVKPPPNANGSGGDQGGES